MDDLEKLKTRVEKLERLLCEMLNDMHALSINTEDRTEFSSELQECMENWLNEL